MPAPAVIFSGVNVGLLSWDKPDAHLPGTCQFCRRVVQRTIFFCRESVKAGIDRLILVEARNDKLPVCLYFYATRVHFKVSIDG
jgi:hypothetical protein